jgi:uncharacterized protein
MTNYSGLRVRILPSIREVPAEAWDACAYARGIKISAENSVPCVDRALPDSKSERLESKSEAVESILEEAPQSAEDPQNPFISHAFLAALEDSGAVSARTGWLPQHVVVEDENGALLAAMPGYLKSHSQGEYVFDHGWAEAYERAGGDYYPKLQVSVPFTPVNGPRLLVKDGPQARAARQALIAGAIELCKLREASSIHLTFLLEREWKFLTELGFLARTDKQFHWINEGYKTFDDFAAALASRKRKQLLRERREAQEGVEIVRLSGSALTEEVWDAFFEFYMDTGSRKWGHPYLNRKFFSLAGQSMNDKIVLILAKRGSRYIAGALNFVGQNTFYGRYWGAIEHRPFLHFELCYYQAIDYAIKHGLARVEAGAQGAHKIARGYLPVTTYSAHYIRDGALRRAVENYLKSERVHVEMESEALAALAPFRKDAQK